MTKTLEKYGFPCEVATALNCLEMAAFFQSHIWCDSEWAEQMAEKQLLQAQAHFLQHGCFTLHEAVTFINLNRF